MAGHCRKSILCNRRHFIAAVIGLALGRASTGAGIGNATTTLRIGLQSDADNLDPTRPRGWATTQVLNAICDKLIDVTPELRYVPQLATEWSWSDGGKALTLKLREGVKFHDGEPLDAAAVKFSIDRHRLMRGLVLLGRACPDHGG